MTRAAVWTEDRIVGGHRVKAGQPVKHKDVAAFVANGVAAYTSPETAQKKKKEMRHG